MDPVTLKLAKNYTDEQLEPQRLKVATLDKSLSDFQRTLASVNVNQEAKQTVSGYGSVSLPKTSANGQVSVSVKGNTFSQFLSYNQQDYDKWLVYGNTTKSTNGISFLSVGYSNRAELVVPTDACIKDNGRYIIIFKALSNSGIVVGTSGDSTSINITTVVGFNKAIIQFDGTVGARFRLWVNNINTLSDIRLIESTSNAENDFNSMTADQFAQKYSFINGTKSTISASRLKSVGKNLFDKNRVSALDVGLTVTTGITSTHSGQRTSDYISVQPNTPYTRTAVGDAQYKYCFYDINKKFISGVAQIGSVTTPTNCYFMRTSWNSADINAIQIEKGTVATPYEPYIESTQYITCKDSESKVGELRSLPNGTKDEIRLSDGKGIFRTKKKLLEVSGITNLVDRDNVTTVDIKKPSDYVSYNKFDDIGYVLDGFNITTYNNMLVSAGNISGAGTVLVFRASFIKGATLQQINNILVGKALTYQLVTPIEIPVEVSGTLLSYPSGTVYFEKAVADAGIYNNGISVLHQDLPIKELERIAKIDFMTGVETELDVSQAVIASDRLSFTHPGLTKNNITAFNYFYDKEGTEGEMTVEFYDSRYVFEDTAVPGKFYKVVRTITNGVIVDTPVEV